MLKKSGRWAVCRFGLYSGLFSSLVSGGFPFGLSVLGFAPSLAQAFTGPAEINPETRRRDELHYEIFRDRASAEAWVRAYDKKFSTGPSREPEREILPANDARSVRAESTVLALWSSFRELFPEMTKNLPTPRVIVLETDSLNGYSAHDPISEKVGFVIVVNAGVFSASVTRDTQRGILAHEMAHLLYLHARPEIGRPRERFFYGLPHPTRQDVSEIANDPGAQKIAEEWQRLARSHGAYARTELLGLPSFYSGGEIFHRLLDTALQEASESHPDICVAADATAFVWQNRWIQMLDVQDFSFRATAEERAEFREISQNFIDALRECLGDEPRSLRSLLQRQYQLDAAEVNHLTLNSEWKEVRDSFADFDALPFVDALLKSNLEAHARMRALERTARFWEIGHYSNEDEADETALRVLLHAPVAGENPLAYVEALMSADELDACRATLRQRKIPASGRLADEHHSLCYRLDRLTKLAPKSAKKRQSPR